MTDDIFFKPPAYGRITNWLGSETVGRLLEFAQAQQDNFSEAGVWNQDKREGEVDLTIRRSWWTEFSGSLRDEIERRAHALLPEMCSQLGTMPFEPTKFEIEMVAHGDGAFFIEHRDRLMSPQLRPRLISAVYYFHRHPKSFSGGVLRIYPIAGSKKSKSFIEIEPVNDTLIFFPSWFPHEVLPVNCPSGRFEDSRFAINCWVHF